MLIYNLINNSTKKVEKITSNVCTYKKSRTFASLLRNRAIEKIKRFGV